MKLTIIFIFAVVAIVCQVSAQAQRNTKTPTTTKKAEKTTQKSTTVNSKSNTKTAKNPPTASPNKSAKKHSAKAAAAPSIVYHNCFCTNLAGKKDLDVKNLNGQWFVHHQASALSFYPFTGECAYGNVTFINSTSLTLTTKSKFHVSTIRAINTTLNYTGNGIFTWSLTNLTIDNNSVPVNSRLNLAVIDTDYKNYTILFICGDYNLGGAAPQTTPSTSADDPHVPPYAFVLLSRSKNTKYKIQNFNNTISALYNCYSTMSTPTNHKNATCKGFF